MTKTTKKAPNENTESKAPDTVAKTEDGLNSLIAEEEAPVAPPGEVPLPPKMKTPLDPGQVANTLTAKFEHWEKGAGEAHERLYRLLGRAYEWAPQVKEQDGLEDAIIALIKEKHKETIKHGSRTGEELLLMLAAGFGDTVNVSRSQWAKALKAADQNKVPRNEYELAEWMREKGGMMKAGALYISSDKADKASKDDLDVSDYFRRAAGNKVMSREAEVAPGLDGEVGMRLTIVDISAGSTPDTRKTDLLLVTQDRLALEAVAKRHRQIARQLWKLNRYALRHARHKEMGKMTKADVTGFVDGVKALLADAGVKHLLFDEGATAPQLPEDVSEHYRFPIIDMSLNVHDPARFIKGAKPGALVPYWPDQKPWNSLSDRERIETQVPAYANQFLTRPIEGYSEKEVSNRLYDLQLKEQALEEERLEREARPQLENV